MSCASPPVSTLPDSSTSTFDSPSTRTTRAVEPPTPSSASPLAVMAA